MSKKPIHLPAPPEVIHLALEELIENKENRVVQNDPSLLPENWMNGEDFRAVLTLVHEQEKRSCIHPADPPVTVAELLDAAKRKGATH